MVDFVEPGGDDFGDDDNDNGNDGLDDIGLLTGEALVSQTKTVRKHVGRFLVMFPIRGIRIFDGLTEQDMEKQILGRFTDFIFKHCPGVKRFNTHYQYVCVFNKMICDRFPSKEGAWKKYRATLR